MKKISGFFILGMFVLTGCPKHEVIPAPEVVVDLNAKFTGTIAGADAEWTQNVAGFKLESPNTTTSIVGGQTEKVYVSRFSSAQASQSLELMLGTLSFNPATGTIPILSSFNSFFTSNLLPSYQINASNGFAVRYTDELGKIWASKTDATNDVEFTNIVQESDAYGDYSKYLCTFECILHRDSAGFDLTLPITNGIFKAWFENK